MYWICHLPSAPGCHFLCAGHKYTRKSNPVYNTGLGQKFPIPTSFQLVKKLPTSPQPALHPHLTPGWEQCSNRVPNSPINAGLQAHSQRLGRTLLASKFCVEHLWPWGCESPAWGTPHLPTQPCRAVLAAGSSHLAPASSFYRWWKVPRQHWLGAAGEAHAACPLAP